MSSPSGLRPFLVYRHEGEQVECALWTLKQGPRALALFLTREQATQYVRSAELDFTWSVFQPAPADLMQIIKQSCASEVTFAVLNPDQEQARQLFSLQQVLEKNGES